MKISYLVPEWCRTDSANSKSGSRLELAFYFLAFFLYGWIFVPLLLDWGTFAWREGLVGQGAQRWLSGQIPYSEFFFPFPPGPLIVEFLLQHFGFDWRAARVIALLSAALSSILVLDVAACWGLSFFKRLLLAALLILWGFPLFNIADGSWVAVLLALISIRQVSISVIKLSLFIGLSFYFHQIIGLALLIGVAVYFAFEKKWFGILKLVTLFIFSVLPIPIFLFLAAGWNGVSEFFSQVFPVYFSYQGHFYSRLNLGWAASPLECFGLWILSLYFVRSEASLKSRRLLQLGVIVYIGMGIYQNGAEFFWGSFILYSLLAWPISLILFFSSRDIEIGRRFLALWLPAFGVWIADLPNFTLSHLLFLFPLSALLFVYSLGILKKRYPWLPGLWLHVPALLLILGGLFSHLPLYQQRALGKEDAFGRVIAGRTERINSELEEVVLFLRSSGLKDGDPVLALPSLSVFYQMSGFRNPSSFDLLFPGISWVNQGSSSEILKGFTAAGGNYIVLEQNQGFAAIFPELHKEILLQFEMLKIFPEHFTVWKRK